MPEFQRAEYLHGRPPPWNLLLTASSPWSLVETASQGMCSKSPQVFGTFCNRERERETERERTPQMKIKRRKKGGEVLTQAGFLQNMSLSYIAVWGLFFSELSQINFQSNFWGGQQLCLVFFSTDFCASVSKTSVGVGWWGTMINWKKEKRKEKGHPGSTPNVSDAEST